MSPKRQFPKRVILLILDPMVFAEHRVVELAIRAHVLPLPLFKRLCHRKTLRHFSCLCLGASIASLRAWLTHHQLIHGCPEFIWETGSWTVHAAGAIPACKQLEPLWVILLGE